MSSAAKDYKRIIVACDGTWVNSDNGLDRSWFKFGKPTGTLARPSNVTRLCRALLPKSKDGVQQICYYQGGLGSANSFWSYFFGGYFGQGIQENIREAYSFICNNYEEGDEIILTGFSRGAFTARSVAGLISSVGLLTKRGLSSFYPIFQDWENQADAKYKPQYGTPSWPLENRPRFKDRRYVGLLAEKGLTRPKVDIKAVGVWDTVGSLGVPTIKLFGLIPLHVDTTKEFAFVNTEVAPNIEHAYQALALDEVRSPFEPTVWESPEASSGAILKTLKQTWFPGVHTSIGGGYEDTSISDITLAWMITQLSNHVSFNTDYIKAQRVQNVDYYKTKSIPEKSWAMGQIQRSDGGALNTMTGRTTRTPGEYHPTDPDTGKDLPRQMRKTHEFVHPSVRHRMDKKGFGLAQSATDLEGKGIYDPAALKGWRFISPEEDSDVGGKFWAGEGKWYVKRKDGKETYIVEDRILEGTAEMDLLDGWPGVRNEIYPPLN